jgi:Transposase DDE domain
LSADGSCRLAVAGLLAWRAARGLSACSADTVSYCDARKRLPEGCLKRLLRETGAALEEHAAPQWRWQGRVVKIFDGSTVTMPDTPANQQAYPQHPRQQPGVGFPLARIAVVFGLATGCVLEAALCRFAGKDQSELGLLRLLRSVFQPGDVMLADRYLCSWFEIALLYRQGVDVVCRLHQSRTADFRRGRRLGANDHVVHWRKPKRRPEWMDEATYASLPEELEIREVRLIGTRPGFRSPTIVVATTLLDAERISGGQLTDLFRQRWHAELDLRSLKQSLHLDDLRCKTPEMVHREIWVHLLAYNLIRTVMAQAAAEHQLPPRTLSFKGALQTLLAFQPRLDACRPEQWLTLHTQLLEAIATHRVGDRPNRIEPRARKRRPKHYPLLQEPRRLAQKRLLLSNYD